MRIASKIWDITARKPSGWLGRLLYRNPKGHEESFRLLLDSLQIEEGDTYCEIGCGGGVLLERALKKASRAAAVDISPDMVALAGRRNRRAMEEGRLEIVVGSADSLPWPDESFACAGSANMFFFLEDPEKVLREIHRVLAPGGRLAIASHPKFPFSFLAKRFFSLWFYSNREMESMALRAGFASATCSTHGLFIQICRAEKGRHTV
jgi:ubiquinone/menaquinone biosynthesis C-methylase UbiE